MENEVKKEVVEDVKVEEPKKRGRKPAVKESEPVVEASSEKAAKVEVKEDKKTEEKHVETKTETKKAEQPAEKKPEKKVEEKKTETKKAETKKEKPSIIKETTQDTIVCKNPTKVFKTLSTKHVATTYQGVLRVMKDTYGAKELGFVPVKFKIPGSGKEFVGFVLAP